MKWTINGLGNCPSSNDLVTIRVAPLTVGGTLSADMKYCGRSTTATINLTGHVGTVQRWERSTDNVNWTVVSPANTTASLTYGNLTATTFYRAVVKSGMCNEAYSTVSTVTITAIPAKPVAQTSFVYCESDAIPALTATGQDLNWYTSTALSNPATAAPTPASAPGTRNFYVTQTVDGCESPYETITVRVNPQLRNNNIGAVQTICQNSAPMQLGQSGPALSGGDGTYSYIWEQSDDNNVFTAIANATVATYQPPALSADKYYRRTVSSGQCESISNVVKITVQGSIASYQVGTAQAICSGEAPTQLVGDQPTGGALVPWHQRTTINIFLMLGQALIWLQVIL